MKKIIFSLLIVFLLPGTAFSSRVFVLCYHSFHGNKKYWSDFSLEEFKKHIDILKADNFKFVTFDDIVNNRLKGNKNILISIDDGNKSVYDAYMKVLKKERIKPLLGIYPAVMGKRKNLTWEQLQELAAEGCEIASHGYYHLYVNEKLYNKDRKGFNREIFYSKKKLEEKLLSKIRIFIYPSGIFSSIAMKSVKEAGYIYAFTIQPKWIDLPLKNNLYKLPRYMITRNFWKPYFNVIKRKAEK